MATNNNNDWSLAGGLLESDGSLSITINTKKEINQLLVITQRSDAQINFQLQKLLVPKPMVSRVSGNLLWNSQKNIEVILSTKIVCLYGNKARDCLIMLNIFYIRKDRKGRSLSVEQKQQIIDLRFQLHGGGTRSLALSREEWEERWNVPLNTSKGTATNLINLINVQYFFRLLKIYKGMKAKTYIVNPNYVVGLVLGDGSFFISYGLYRIVPGFTIAGDKLSRFSLVVAGYALTGQIGKIVNPKNNSYRLSFVSYGKNSQYIVPFFSKNLLLPGKKQREFDTWSSTIKEFIRLKQKRLPGSPHEVNKILEIVRKTYDFNPTPRARKYNLEQYCELLKPLLKQGKVAFY